MGFDGRALVMATALLAGACGSSPPSDVHAMSPLCGQLATVHTERTRLGDAFRAAFGGNLDEAAAAAGQIRVRLTSLMSTLPAIDSDRSLREAVVSEALLVQQSAHWINDGLGDQPDLASILVEGRFALEAGDRTMRELDAWALAGPCPGLSLVIDPVVFPDAPSTPDPRDLGIPRAIGQWQLGTTPNEIPPASLLADVISEAGGDPATSVDISVRVHDGASEPSFDVLRVPGATLDSFAAAAQKQFWPDATVFSEATVKGWHVLRYETPANAVGGPEVYSFTARGDRIYIFHSLTDDQLAAILGGLR